MQFKSFILTLTILLAVLGCSKEGGNRGKAENVKDRITTIMSSTAYFSEGNKIQDIENLFSSDMFDVYSFKVVDDNYVVGRYEYIKETMSDNSVWDIVVNLSKTSSAVKDLDVDDIDDSDILETIGNLHLTKYIQNVPDRAFVFANERAN